MEKRILVTGFGPFGEEICNPSLEAVRALPDKAGGALILKEELPVVFGLGAERLMTLIEEKRPCAVLGTGLAAGRRAVTPEVIAVNLKNARIPDNQGMQPLWEKIRDGARTVYFPGWMSERQFFPCRRQGSRQNCPFLQGLSCATKSCTACWKRICREASSMSPVPQSCPIKKKTSPCHS